MQTQRHRRGGSGGSYQVTMSQISDALDKIGKKKTNGCPRSRASSEHAGSWYTAPFARLGGNYIRGGEGMKCGRNDGIKRETRMLIGPRAT